MTDSVCLHITLVDPPPGHAFCLQRGKGAKAEMLAHVEATGGDLTFELVVSTRPGRTPGMADFGGPFVQGRPSERFFYLVVGQCSTLVEPQWIGRVKVPLASVAWATVEEALAAGARLRAGYLAARPDGRPVLASVPLLGEGWTLA